MTHVPMWSIAQLNTYSLEEVNRFYQQGRIPEKIALEYVRLWHAGPHISCAMLTDGAIRTIYHARKSPFCRSGACKGTCP